MIRPMLGVTVDLEKIKYPVYMSPKLDGIRVTIQGNTLVSRNGKPIPNKYTQSLFSNYENFDGELIVGEETAPNVFQVTTSGVMTVLGEPYVRMFVFDHINYSGGIMERYKGIEHTTNPNIRIVPQTLINNEKELLNLEQSFLTSGYEGAIIRYPDAEYKNGRSTIKEGALLKLKRFSDSEAYIIGFEPLLRNNNKATIDALGYTERSTSKVNMVEDDLLGNLIVKDVKTDIEFKIGSGFTENQRKEIWYSKDHYKFKLVKYKYFSVGIKDKPRFPIFLGFRNEDDL